MVLKEAIEILEENGYIVEGRFARAIATGALAASAMFGHANATEPTEQVKEISSTIFAKDIQKDFGIKNVTMDANMINKLAADVKSQIKTDWENFGYDNTRVIETKAWARAQEIRDTLQDVSPWLCNLFRASINRELHNQLKITPML